jgi:hypothetical protein
MPADTCCSVEEPRGKALSPHRALESENLRLREEVADLVLQIIDLKEQLQLAEVSA